MRYPTFDRDEFNCVTSLTGVRNMWRHIRAEQAVELKRKKVEALRMEAPAGRKLATHLDERIRAIVKSRKDIPDEARVNQLRHLISEYRDRLRTENLLGAPSVRSETNRILREIIDLYLGFNITGFRQDFEAIFGEETGEDEDLEFHERELKELQKALQKEMYDKKATGYFGRGLPARWRGMVRDQMLHGDMARAILRQFCLDWRDRQSRFSVPVTINGVAISTLPSHMRDEWQKTWDYLSMNEIPRSPVWHPFSCDIMPQVAKENATTALPETFEARQ